MLLAPGTSLLMGSVLGAAGASSAWGLMAGFYQGDHTVYNR